MTSALEKLARLASWGKSPQPGSLAAAALSASAAPQLPSPALLKMSTMPTVVDTAAWYEEHAQLCYDLQVAAIRAASNPDAEAQVGKAHAALLAHAAIINGGSEPVLLAKDGIHPIPFERLAAARAKVQVLTAEIAQIRDELAAVRAEGWRPEFDAMSPRQEELAIQFCQEIAGPRGAAGSPPDPVRLLEMAQALYEAERAEALPASKGVQ